ncbi:ankyrin repeat-containing domain protein [Trichoderma pleuroticola]
MVTWLAQVVPDLNARANCLRHRVILGDANLDVPTKVLMDFYRIKNRVLSKMITPLQLVAILGHTQIYKVLIQAGVDRSASGYNGRNALDFAARYGRHENFVSINRLRGGYLGDVVVSKPDSYFPGVIQWDLGKIEQGGTIERTGSLNNPPTALLTSLAKLETKREMEGSQIPNHLAATGENETEEDGNEGESVDCRFCDFTQARKRKPRATRIHHGLIASGNMVIKDAQFRNQLNERFSKKILCVEMEAAGLMNDFPCLVIRGICDYADSHKNKAWQEYAAAVAAAFAKELLLVIPAQAVEQMDPITSILSDIRCDVGLAVEYLEEARAFRHDEKDQKILDWISLLDYGAEHSDVLKWWQPGTGQWLLESTEFKEFLERNDKQILFCPGIPGAGKTVMAATMVDYLHKQFAHDSSICIAYIYFNFRRHSEQDPDAVFSSLLKQISRRQRSLHSSVTMLYNTHVRERTRPSLKEIIKAFQDVVRIHSRVFVVIDALDECASSNHCRETILSEIIGCTKQSGLKLVATARDIPEISERFKSTLRLEIKAVESDIQKYIDSRLSSLSPTSVISKSKTLQEDIKTEISAAAGSMFLLAQLHFDQLMDCITRKAVLNTLKALPTGSNAYDYTYDAAMDRINQQSSSRKQLAIDVLSWITHAMRPLSVAELQHALAVEIEEDEFDEENIPQIEDIVSTSVGLVTIDENSKVIRLVHYTTQEFFERNQEKWLPTAKTYVAEVCSCYLSYSVFRDGLREPNPEILEKLGLFKYAVNYWQDHVSLSGFSQRHVDFLKKTSNLRVFEHKFSSQKPNYELFTGIHIAAKSRWNEIVEALLKDITDADAHDEFNRTPFYLAASGGHEAVMRTLLNSHQVDVNVISSESRYTPLICAAQWGHADAVKLLLDTGKVNVGHTCRRQKAALWYAAVGGHVDATRLLLNARNYDLDMVREIYSSALLGAVIMKQERIVHLLLETGYADVNVQTTKQHSPFSWDYIPKHTSAEEKFFSMMMGQNLEGFKDTTWKCPSAEMMGKDGYKYRPMEWSLNQSKSPLCLAVEFGHKNLAEIFLSRKEVNVDLTSKDLYLSTAFSMAARCGRTDIFRLLLDSGRFDINSKDGFGQTPLMIATLQWHKEIVDLLLHSNSLAIDLQDELGRTALFYAVAHNRYDIAELLIHTGKANIHIKDAYGYSPLFDAVMRRSEETVRLLFEALGANIDTQDDYAKSLLLLAVEGGRKNIVKLCLETGKLDVNARDHSGLTPLLLAAKHPSNMLDTIRLLLNTANVDINVRDYKHQRTALLWAAYAGSLESFTVLLQTGKFDINERDLHGLTPFTLAAQRGNTSILKYLLSLDTISTDVGC